MGQGCGGNGLRRLSGAEPVDGRRTPSRRGRARHAAVALADGKSWTLLVGNVVAIGLSFTPLSWVALIWAAVASAVTISVSARRVTWFSWTLIASEILIMVLGIVNGPIALSNRLISFG